MPKLCSLQDAKLQYPENWSLTGPVEDSDGTNVVIESPEGMFLSMTRYADQSDAKDVLRQAVEAMQAEYDEVEESSFDCADAMPDETAVELQFYCQHYIVTSRLFAIQNGDDALLVQIQAENRDFDRSELVFDAMLKSLRDSLRSSISP